MIEAQTNPLIPETVCIVQRFAVSEALDDPTDSIFNVLNILSPTTFPSDLSFIT